MLASAFALDLGATPASAATMASAAAAAKATSPHRYVDVAASAALYQVEAAKLAERRARSSKVRALAKAQKDVGYGIGGQLSWAGRRVNALPDNVLTAKHQRMLDTLARSSNFDATYLAQAKALVPEMRQFHESYATSGGSATLRPVAQFGAAKMRDQEVALQRLN
ncbi:DUF4142 domain-containing protein [Sphingomicrobium aestuariivivum]|uniref:DUF4142 domain-containing protein n=1 Tax=Sphingomicrobium aestuariivivum TaxID=1582356 RepID=UPI001FD69BDC|nr:DUF4142 domain-containing protein [Sphingomicrobium aestuariivivum]MCJ8191407.1 DUF4142 domain-containing protein [Sphingomicrobium aestuariivivum]